MLRLNLKVKLIGLIAGLIVIVLLAAGILITRQVENAMDNEIHKRVLAVANDLARFSSSALISRDLASLRYYVTYTMQQDYIHHAVILDTHGKVIMHNKLSEVGKIYGDKLSRAAIRVKKPIQGEHYSTKEGEILNDISVPVEVAGTRLGTVIIGCSHAGIEKEIAILKRQIEVMVLMAILVGMVFAVILATYISGPLRKLRDAAVEIGKGPKLTLQDLDIEDVNKGDTYNKQSEIPFPPIPPTGIDLSSVQQSLERYYIEEALRLAGGNESKAAQLLNINHHTFRYRRKKLLKK